MAGKRAKLLGDNKMSEHMVTDSAWPKEGCLHNKTHAIHWCKARKKECQSSDCQVLDDQISDCNELEVMEICDKCNATLED